MVESDRDATEPAGARKEETADILVHLAERTVIQAEAMAKEITDHARQQGETEAKELRERTKSEADEGARRIIEAAEQKSANSIDGAEAEGRRILEAATNQAAAITDGAMAKAQEESEKLLEKARAEGQEIVTNAQAEEQEILENAHRDASNVTDTARFRGENIESNARVRAEFVIRQMDQLVLDGIRQAVMETCNNNILPALDAFGRHALDSSSFQPSDKEISIGQEPLDEAAPDVAETSTANKSPRRRGGRISARN